MPQLTPAQIGGRGARSRRPRLSARGRALALPDVLPVLPVLSAAREQELALAARAGSKAARDLLVESNLRLVASVACAFRERGLEDGDLIQAGTIGLIHAVDRFDPGRGVRLSTYACWWIRQAIQREVVERGRCVRLPHREDDRLRALLQAQDGALMATGHEIGEAALAEATGMTEAAVSVLLRAREPAMPLDAPMGDGWTLGDVVGDGSRSLESGVIARLVVEEALAALSAVEREVIERYYGLRPESDPESLREIGLAVSLTAERVRQIKLGAERKLREALASDV